MSEAETITERDGLNEFIITAGLSSLSTGTPEASPQSAPPTQQARLVLLQPLANPDMLEACRNPHSRVIRRSNGLREFLDIPPLRDGLGVQVQDVMNLVIIIATETRIRAKDNVCFELVCDETERVALGPMIRLNRQLLALQQFPGKKDEKRANADTSFQGTGRAPR
ncbi:hypothetical protein CNMCM6106_007791 [Aspergillus hiratsukae]|uniref:Uncharacterized protein n=1 Tax=Aspergillus hiratsukae TaxID=1194566 RepID=A0A8H6PSS1_9EURO|nr:hypothetical protein CNMCM6106_007791 [Aspergillus hiratsukae]